MRHWEYQARTVHVLREHDRDTQGLPEGERKMMRQRFLRRLNLGERYKLALSDDLGTEYRGMGGGTNASDNEQSGLRRHIESRRRATEPSAMQWPAWSHTARCPKSVAAPRKEAPGRHLAQQ